MTIIHGDSRVHIATMTEFDRLVARLRDARQRGDRVGIDYETTGPSIRGASASKPDVLRHLPVGTGYAFGDGERVYLPSHRSRQLPKVAVGVEQQHDRLLRYAYKSDAHLVAHNAPFEYQVTANVHGGELPTCQWYDSVVAAWMAGWKLPGKRGLKLKALAEVYLGYRGPTYDEVAAGRDAADVPVTELAPYCANDAWLALALLEAALREFDRLRCWGHWELERRVMPVTAHMMATGVAIDEPLLLGAAEACESEMVRVAEEFRTLTSCVVLLPTKGRRPKTCPMCAGAGYVMEDGNRFAPCPGVGCVNGELTYKNGKPRMHTVVEDMPTRAGADIGSDAQVARWLFDELGWWPKAGHPTTDSGERPSTKAEHIMPLAVLPGNAGLAARLRLRYQALRKYASTYTRGLVALAHQSGDGRLHTSYKQTGTDTSRYSSSLPNISNLPSAKRQELPWLHDLPDIRAAFKPTRPGWRIVIYDFSQIELRLMAHYSRDAGLLAAYPRAGVARDLHAELMERQHCDRRAAKIIRFSSLYMISAPRLALKMAMGANDWSGRYSPEYAQDALDTLWVLHPGVPAYWDAAIEYARSHGYATTITGFKRPITEWRGRKSIGVSSRRAVNVPIQGSAGGIVKWVLAELYDYWSAAGMLGRVVNIQGQTYDEVIVECAPEVVDVVSKVMHATMVRAGEHFGLRVPLEAEGGSGDNWSEAK